MWADQTAQTLEVRIYDSTGTTLLGSRSRSAISLGTAGTIAWMRLSSGGSAPKIGADYLRTDDAVYAELPFPVQPATVAMVSTSTMASDGTSSGSGPVSSAVTMASTSTVGVAATVQRVAAVPMESTSTLALRSGLTVAIIGDSTALQSGLGEAKIRALLTARGYTDANIYFYACSGKTLTGADTSGYSTFDNLAQARAQFGGEPDTWLIWLGGNNAGSSDATNTNLTNQVLNAIGTTARRQIWMNLSQQNGYVDETDRLHFNDLVKPLIEARSNGSVADWHSFIKADPAENSYWTDGRHMTTTGYDVKNGFAASSIGTPAQLVTRVGAVAMISTSSVGVVAQQTATVALVSSSTMGVTGVRTTPSTAPMASLSTMTVAPLVLHDATVPMASASSMSVAPAIVHPAAIAFTGTNVTGASAGGDSAGTVPMAGTSSMSVTPAVTRVTGVTMAGLGTMLVTALIVRRGTVAHVGASTLGVTGSTSGMTTIALAGASTLAVLARQEALAALAMVGVNTMTTAGTSVNPGEYRDITVLSITHRPQRAVTITERPQRVVTIQERT